MRNLRAIETREVEFDGAPGIVATCGWVHGRFDWIGDKNLNAAMNHRRAAQKIRRRVVRLERKDGHFHSPWQTSLEEYPSKGGRVFVPIKRSPEGYPLIEILRAKVGGGMNE